MTGDTDDAFDDVELDEDDILGTRTYEGVLYSEAEANGQAPVDALTGEKTRAIPSVDDARAFAERSTRDDGHAYVAVVQSTERMVESRSKPYVSTVCFDAKVVRGPVVGRDEYGRLEHANDGHALERAYRAAAFESDDHEVFMEEADYETGTVSITVRRV